MLCTNTNLRMLKMICLMLILSLGALPIAIADDDTPKRIISMSPGTTEMLFALGQGQRVVGVTRYCDYPTSATTKTSIGGFFDPNYEKIITLKSDLVILLTPQDAAKAELERLKIPTLTVPNETIDDIYTALLTIGKTCGVDEKAQAFVADLKQRVEKVKNTVKDRKPPRVLICIQRDMTSANMSGLYTAGKGTFYDEIITKAGGLNAVTDNGYPKLSAEGVIALNPDIIIDLAGDLDKVDKTPETIIKQWDFFKTVKAVRDDRVHLIVGYHALRPSPRFVLFLEQLASILHPEAFKDTKAE
jgi:iron complex transport system substrate-binding protein